MANQIVVSDKKWGYVSVLAATVLYGIWNTFSKILLQDLDPLALSALVYCIAGIFLFIVRFSGFNNRLMGMLDSKSEAETHMSMKDYLVLIITSLAGSVIAPVVYLTGLNQITAVSASLLLNAEVLFIIIIGILVLNERFQKKEGIGLILLLVGTVFLATNGNLQEFSVSENLGTLLVIIAAFFWSIDTTMSKFLSNKRDFARGECFKMFNRWNYTPNIIIDTRVKPKNTPKSSAIPAVYRACEYRIFICDDLLRNKENWVVKNGFNIPIHITVRCFHCIYSSW